MTKSADSLAAAVLARPPRLGRTRLVTIDGPAGAGKTTLAADLAAALGGAAAVVHMDDLYAGWGDLEGSWDRLADWVLVPLAEGRRARMRRYDWYAERFGEDWYDVPAADVLIVEGVSAGRRAGDARRTLSIWVDAPEDVRLARGLERDGEALREQWLRWMSDERAHFDRERTRERADVVLDGTAPAMRRS